MLSIVALPITLPPIVQVSCFSPHPFQYLLFVDVLIRAPCSQSYPSRSSQSTKLSSLCYIVAFHQKSVLHMVLYVCHCYSINLFHPLLHPLCPQVLSLCVSITVLQIGSSIPFFLEKAMAPYSSTLTWKIPWMEEPVRLQSMGSIRGGHD